MDAANLYATVLSQAQLYEPQAELTPLDMCRHKKIRPSLDGALIIVDQAREIGRLPLTGHSIKVSVRYEVPHMNDFSAFAQASRDTIERPIGEVKYHGYNRFATLTLDLRGESVLEFYTHGNSGDREEVNSDLQDFGSNTSLEDLALQEAVEGFVDAVFSSEGVEPKEAALVEHS